MIINHEGQCIAVLPRQGCYCKWREIKIMNGHRTPRNRGYVCRRGMCFGPRKSPEALNHGQRETVVQTIDRRLEEMIGSRLVQLSLVISTGLLHVMDATGRRHTVTMDMAHSYEVCSCARYDMIFFFHLLKFPATYRSS